MTAEINLTVQADTQAETLAAWETLTRVAAGFAFDGLHPELSMERIDLGDDADQAAVDAEHRNADDES